VVNALPKTRSGKLLRRSIQALAESRDPGDLSTLDDPASLDEVRRALARGAMRHRFGWRRGQSRRLG
jgi:propionyl-CoA synthetase